MQLAALVLWLHVLAAVAWVGGMVFLAAVLAPITRGMPLDQRTALFGSVGRRFRVVGWVSIAALIITGIGNLLFRFPSFDYLIGSRYGMVLGVKLAFVVGMIVLSVLHDFVLGPRQTALAKALRDGADSTEQQAALLRLRRQVRIVAQINLLLGLGVLFLAVSLRWT